MNRFKHRSPWTGKIDELAVVVNNYAYGGGIRIDFKSWDEQYSFWEPYATLTKNLEEPAQEGCGFVDVNNLGEEILQELEEQGVAKLTGKVMRSGWCMYPEVKFNMDVIKEMTL